MRSLAAICGVSLMLITSAYTQAQTQAQTEAQHQGWPAKTVKFVVAAGAGSSTDRHMRILAAHLSKKWGQPVVVENKVGATSIIGNNFVAKSPPDGYTLLSTFTALVQTPSLVKNMPYDVEKDLIAVTQTVSAVPLLLVRTESPYQNMQEFITAAKTANPPFSYGTPGKGHTYHVFGETMFKGVGIELTHIPYKSEYDSVNGLLGGQLTSSFSAIGTVLPFIKANRLRALGRASKTRSKMLPNVPSFAELGIPMPDITGWFGILAPAGTPAAIVRKVSADIREIFALPEMIRFVEVQEGMDLVASTPEAFAERIHVELGRWKQLLLGLGITPE